MNKFKDLNEHLIMQKLQSACKLKILNKSHNESIKVVSGLKSLQT